MRDISEYVERVKQLNPTIVIREAALSDADKFVSLFNTYYKRKTNIGYFTWQFFDTPCPSKLFAAFDGDQLVGFFGVKIYPVTGNINTGFVVDFLIHETYRKRGIGYLLAGEVENFCSKNKVAVLTGLPNAFGNAALRSMGWQSIAKIDTLINEKIETLDIDLNDVEIQEQKKLVQFKKTDELNKWRFDDHPVYKYDRISVDKNNYAVIKVFIDPVTGNSFLDIVDLEFSQRPEILDQLLNKVKQKLPEQIQSVTIWALSHTVLFNCLMKLDFKILPQERFFCVKLLDESYSQLTNIENWDLMEMNSEIY
jgi:GNAT superfamily N-acetyltransferase